MTGPCWRRLRQATRLACLMGALLLDASCRKSAPVPSARAGDLDLRIQLEPDPPVGGENELRLEVREAATGSPVDGARVSLQYDMPAMGAMPEMKGGGQARSTGPGRYALTYSLPMEGGWTLSLAVEAAGHARAAAELKLVTGRPGFSLTRDEDPIEGGRAKLDLTPSRLQRIGVVFAPVTRKQLRLSLRAPGRVAVDERKLTDVTLKFEAFVERLFVAATGQHVRAGQPLLSIYSPELLAAEQELLTARRAGAASEILHAARQRLRLWDLTPAQLAALERRGRAEGRIVIGSPASGVVLDKPVVEGAHLSAGSVLYRIGDLGRVWVQASLFERDAALAALGQPASVSLPSLPDQKLAARVTFVSPTVDERTRTLDARLELQNPNLLLKPGMFVDVNFESLLDHRLSVPDAAVLLSGTHRYVFVDEGGGRLRPTEIQLGVQAGDDDEVTAGLREGDRVALGASFLLSSEAQLRDALPRWSAP